jgi:hypothetical protein
MSAAQIEQYLDRVVRKVFRPVKVAKWLRRFPTVVFVTLLGSGFVSAATLVAGVFVAMSNLLSSPAGVGQFDKVLKAGTAPALVGVLPPQESAADCTTVQTYPNLGADEIATIQESRNEIPRTFTLDQFQDRTRFYQSAPQTRHVAVEPARRVGCPDSYDEWHSHYPEVDEWVVRHTVLWEPGVDQRRWAAGCGLTVDEIRRQNQRQTLDERGNLHGPRIQGCLLPGDECFIYAKAECAAYTFDWPSANNAYGLALADLGR